MALVPTLASMAALTLLQHPEHQPEGVSVDYTPFRQPAITTQRMVRGAWQRRHAITIQRMMRGVLVRIRRIARLLFDHRLMRYRVGFNRVYMPYMQAQMIGRYGIHGQWRSRHILDMAGN